ncbi:metallophosphoesterase family protein [Embleya sp. NPDC055664]|uniref:metallophosphoesterase family protein n=1 Tax=Embleya sp. NPDC059237 TaxID=3346784 RepID=UPI0036A001D2
MSTARSPERALYAVSDLHSAIPSNRRLVEGIRPGHDEDWILVGGDVAEHVEETASTLRLLAERFARVIWVPGNHELWSTNDDPVQLRGEERYRHLVAMCGELGVLTPEDPFPVWDGPGETVTVAPMFVLYDYTWWPPGASTQQQALDAAYEAGVVCSDEFMLHPDPYPTRGDWCRARVAYTEDRLVAAADPAAPFLMVNHFPLVRQPTDVLWYPEFAQWCGTDLTADWHRRFPTAAVVYGHLHIPRTTWYDGVRFEEVSLGYPRERKNGLRRPIPRRILPAEVAGTAGAGRSGQSAGAR